MKKFIQAKLFILASLLFFSFTPPKNGKVVVVISFDVKNFTEWKKGFDAGAPLREKAGIKVMSICSTLENENEVMVIEEAENLQAANNFLGILKDKLKEDFNKYKISIYDKVD